MQIIKQTKNLNNVLALHRKNKFDCDKIDYELAVTISCNKLKNLQKNKNLNDDLRSEILAGQNIPTYDLLIFYKSNTPLEAGLTSLCKKGLSFVPVPPSYNWSQLHILHIDFDCFRKRLPHVIYLEMKIVTILEMLRTTNKKNHKMEISKYKLSRVANNSNIS